MIRMIQMWKYGRHAFKLLMTTAMLIGLGGIYAASPAPVVEAGSQAALPAGTLWSAGQETGDLSEWSLNDGGGIFNTGTGVASATSSLANSGRNAAALTISNAANATQAVRLFRWSEPRTTPEAYYSIWLYFPETYAPTSWWNIEQWKSKMSETINDPLWTLNVGNRSGQMYLYLYDWLNGASVSQPTVHYLPVGKWFHLETFYRQATDKTGQITMWQDGAKILDVSGVSTKRVGDEVQWSVDNYTDGITPSDATIYLDDAVISTTRIGDLAAQPTVTAQPRSPGPQEPALPGATRSP